MMAFSQFQRCLRQGLRPLPTTGAHRLRLHPARNCLSSGHADSVKLRILGTTRETLTEPEQVRPGEESGTVHTHPRLHPASREQTLLRLRGVMNAPSSAPPPDSGSRAPVSPHITQPTAKASLKPAAAALKENSGIRMSGSLLRSQPHIPDGLKGEDAPCRTHPPRYRAARQAGRTAAPRRIGTVSGSAVHRPSARSGRPPADAAAPPHRPVRSAHSPVIYFVYPYLIIIN